MSDRALVLRAVKTRKHRKSRPMTRAARKAFYDRLGIVEIPGINRIGQQYWADLRCQQPQWKGLGRLEPTSAQVEETIEAMLRDGEAFRVTHGDGSSHLVPREAVYAGG